MTRAYAGNIARALTHPYTHLGLRVALGGVFILSSIAKLPHHTEFEGIVKDYDLLPDALATAYANALPWVELLVGFYLVFGVLVRPSAAVAVLMGTSFMIANVSALAKDKEHCGSCFGDVWTLPVWEAIAIDCGILIAAMILLSTFPRGGPAIGLERWLNRAPKSKKPSSGRKR